MVLRARLPVVLALLLALAAGRAGATSLIPTSELIPDDLVLIDFAGSGLDWVYAGPYAPASNNYSIEAPAYRAAEGWREATDDEWASRPDWSDFIVPGFTAADVELEVTHQNYRFASAYWSLHDHVDLFEAQSGHFYRAYDGHPAPFLADSGETWYVRASQAALVPDGAATLPLLVAAGAVMLIGARRARRR